MLVLELPYIFLKMVGTNRQASYLLENDTNMLKFS